MKIIKNAKIIDKKQNLTIEEEVDKAKTVSLEILNEFANDFNKFYFKYNENPMFSLEGNLSSHVAILVQFLESLLLGTNSIPGVSDEEFKILRSNLFKDLILYYKKEENKNE